MPVPFNEAMYPGVKQWLVENPQDKRLPELIKKDLLRFERLTDAEKEMLQDALLAIHDLPEVLQQFMPDRLGTLPVELLDMVGKHLTPQDRRELAATDKRMYSVFSPPKLHAKFLECVAYGQQDKAEKLLSQVFHGQPARIQAVLLDQGTFTDYSGRTFKNCSAYEYAYWAKDTHMCRMLERYMDDETKAQMLTRIDAIEAHGLTFQQNDEEHRSAHFDFTPLKEAYQRCLDRHDALLAADDWVAMDAAWLDVGKAQRNVPAHVAQEYCRPDRSFLPRPKFNEEKLLRELTFYDRVGTGDVRFWFPLAASNSGLGFDFLLARSVGYSAESMDNCSSEVLVDDLVAVSRLDEVRTDDLVQLRKTLFPNPSPGFVAKK